MIDTTGHYQGELGKQGEQNVASEATDRFDFSLFPIRMPRMSASGGETANLMVEHCYRGPQKSISAPCSIRSHSGKAFCDRLFNALEYRRKVVLNSDGRGKKDGSIVHILAQQMIVCKPL